MLSMALKTVPVDILTSSYRIVGKLSITTTTGVLGTLSDTTHSHLEITDANMARIHMATKLVEHASIVRVVKHQVVAMCLERREDVGPQRNRGTYIKLANYPIRVTTNIYEMEGTLVWPGRFDVSSILAEGACDFIPVYDASLGAILFPSLLIQSPVILFNRAFMNTCVLMNEVGVSS